jgi:guanylate kinase
VHYHFVDKVEFDARLSKGLFFEHAKFGGNKYGTEKRNIELASSSGNDLLMAIDVQGVRRLKELCPERVVTVFLFPPSFADLEQRLRRRGTESEEMQERRLRIAEQEIKELSAPGFADYFLINDDLEAAVQGAHAVLKAERQRFSRVSAEFLSSILEP